MIPPDEDFGEIVPVVSDIDDEDMTTTKERSRDINGSASITDLFVKDFFFFVFLDSVGIAPKSLRLERKSRPDNVIVASMAFS